MHFYFVGLDVHKQMIAYCVKTAAGEIVSEGKIAATRACLDEWIKTLPGAWVGGMEAMLFSHWIDWHLKPHATGLEMGHPGAHESDQRWKEEERCRAKVSARAK